TQTEFAVAEDRNFGSFRNRRLIENLASGGKRLDKHGGLCGNGIGNDMEVDLGQGQKFAERAWIPHNSEYRARRTMPAHPVAAPIAFPARKIDFADYAPTQQIRILGLNHF